MLSDDVMGSLFEGEAHLLLVPVDSLEVLHKVRWGQGIGHRAGLMASVQLRWPWRSTFALRLSPSPSLQACSAARALQCFAHGSCKDVNKCCLDNVCLT